METLRDGVNTLYSCQECHEKVQVHHSHPKFKSCSPKIFSELGDFAYINLNQTVWRSTVQNYLVKPLNPVEKKPINLWRNSSKVFPRAENLCRREWPQ